MATASDIITDALLMLGVYSPGQQLAAADAATSLSVLNDMLDSWSNEALTCYATLEQALPLQVGVSRYSIGPGGNLNGPRPLRVLDGPGAAYLIDGTGNRYGVDIIPQDQWNLIGSPQVNSNLPDTAFYDPQFPLGYMNIFPIPNMSYNLYFDSYLAFTTFTTLAQAVTLPPGYKLALGTNLAVALKPYFTQSKLDDLVLSRASVSKANIQRTNLRPNVAVYDPELVSKGASGYNVYTDGRSSS